MVVAVAHLMVARLMVVLDSTAVNVAPSSDTAATAASPRAKVRSDEAPGSALRPGRDRCDRHLCGQLHSPD